MTENPLPVNLLWESLCEIHQELQQLEEKESGKRIFLEEKLTFLKKRLQAEFPNEANQ